MRQNTQKGICENSRPNNTGLIYNKLLLVGFFSTLKIECSLELFSNIELLNRQSKRLGRASSIYT